MDDSLLIAVDLGAGSGRVFLGELTPDEPLIEEIRRFHYPPRQSDGHLRWDFAHILSEVKVGLCAAGARSRELGRRVRSIGVASWGVDYAFIDAGGNLVEDPISYRDARTHGVMEKVFAHLTREELFTRTGLQLMPINTLFQLYAHAEAGIPRSADRLLLIPDLVHFSLTGRAVTEYTNATTTQMINARTRTWDLELLAKLSLPARLLPEIVFAGMTVGPLCPSLADEFGLENAEIVAPATHDTGSAVAGAPLADGWAFISSGTWSLVGVERSDVLINADVSLHNYTNEGGAFDTVRFLKNVMGLWILESCRREWNEQGLQLDYEGLLGQIAESRDYSALIFPDDPRFFSPTSMLGAIEEQLAETDQTAPRDPVIMAKVILDSLAFRYASVLGTIELLTGRKINGVQIVGGGSLNDYLNQATADATNKIVASGPAEATVTGNLLVQAVAAGQFTSLAEARLKVSRNLTPKRFTPRPSPALAEARRKYELLETRYVN